MVRIAGRPQSTQTENGRRILRCRREESRLGRTVEAVEEALGHHGGTGMDNFAQQAQSNIIYYFVELRRPQAADRTNYESSRGSGSADPHWQMEFAH